jgi:hypothetical protein
MKEPAEINNLALLKSGLMIFIFALDCVSPPDTIVPVFYIVLLLIGKPMNIYSVWGFALASVAFTMVSPILSVPAAPGCPERIFWINRLLVLVAVLMTAFVVHQRAVYQK